MRDHGTDFRGTTGRQADVERLIEFVPIVSPSTHGAGWKAILSQTKPLRYAVSGRGSTPDVPALLQSALQPKADVSGPSRHVRSGQKQTPRPRMQLPKRMRARPPIMRSSRIVENDD